jgi:hypothetical protein
MKIIESDFGSMCEALGTYLRYKLLIVLPTYLGTIHSENKR